VAKWLMRVSQMHGVTEHSGGSTCRALALLALALTIAGCATVKPLLDAASGRTAVPVVYRDSYGNALSVDRFPAGGTVWLAAIPGAIFGRPVDALEKESVASIASSVKEEREK